MFRGYSVALLSDLYRLICPICSLAHILFLFAFVFLPKSWREFSTYTLRFVIGLSLGVLPGVYFYRWPEVINELLLYSSSLLIIAELYFALRHRLHRYPVISTLLIMTGFIHGQAIGQKLMIFTLRDLQLPIFQWSYTFPLQVIALVLALVLLFFVRQFLLRSQNASRD